MLELPYNIPTGLPYSDPFSGSLGDGDDTVYATDPDGNIMYDPDGNPVEVI